MMPESVLVDVNVPREVCDRLSEMGFETLYVTDIFSDDIDDNEILKWIEENHCYLLTKDKNFPEGGNGYKIVLKGESSVKLSRESFYKLTEKGIYPEALTGAWLNG